MTKDVYDELADMLCSEGIRVGPGMKTPEFKEILRLQYSPDEARLAVQIGFSGGKLDELAEKTGLKKATLKKKLHAMAQKGTLWIDPASEDPTYRALQVEAPGLIETAGWVSDKFPWRAELRKQWHSYKRVYFKEGATLLGPVVPVWASVPSLPPDAQVSENIVDAVKQADYWCVSNCPCRIFQQTAEPDNECQHLLETCMTFGDFGRWVAENGFGRELTCDEAIQILRKCEYDGLIHGGSPEYGILCNCCKHACFNFVGMQLGLSHVMAPTPFVAVCDEEACTACMICADRCHVNAINVDSCATVDRDVCIGCGVCVVGCEQGAMRLERRSNAGK